MESVKTFYGKRVIHDVRSLFELFFLLLILIMLYLFFFFFLFFFQFLSSILGSSVVVPHIHSLGGAI